MIYLDALVALVHLLGEDRRAPERLWADALHLASADFLRAAGAKVEIAAYDDRLRRAAAAMGFALFA